MTRRTPRGKPYENEKTRMRAVRVKWWAEKTRTAQLEKRTI